MVVEARPECLSDWRRTRSPWSTIACVFLASNSRR
jgi:hypothetical protein